MHAQHNHNGQDKILTPDLAAAQKDPVKMKYIYHTLKEELLKVDLVLTPGEYRHWLNDAMN